MVPLRIACPKCSGNHVQPTSLHMQCSGCGSELTVVAEPAVAAERAAVVAYLRRRAYVSDPPVAGALRAAADDVEAAMHREGR